MNYRPKSAPQLSPRFQLDCDALGLLVQFETEAAMVFFIQNELPRELVKQQAYETRTLH